MKDKISKQEKENLSSKIVLISSLIILYAILLIFVQQMMQSSITVNGAVAFIEIIRWFSLGGAMLCAAWSAYKENKGFFIYCAICVFIFLSTTVILYCGKHNHAFLINFFSLAVIFIITNIYYALKIHHFLDKKIIKFIYYAVCTLIFLLIMALCIWQRY